LILFFLYIDATNSGTHQGSQWEGQFFHTSEILAQHCKQDNPFTPICSVFSIGVGRRCSAI